MLATLHLGTSLLCEAYQLLAKIDVNKRLFYYFLSISIK